MCACGGHDKGHTPPWLPPFSAGSTTAWNQNDHRSAHADTQHSFAPQAHTGIVDAKSVVRSGNTWPDLSDHSPHLLNPLRLPPRGEVHLLSGRRLTYDRRCHEGGRRGLPTSPYCHRRASPTLSLISQSPPLPVSTWYDDDGTVYCTAGAP